MFQEHRRVHSQHSQTDEQTPFDMLELAGLSAWPASTNDYETRTTVLDVQLRQLHEGQPAILIDPRCTTLIKGLAGAFRSFMDFHQADDLIFERKQDAQLGAKISAHL